MEGRRCSCRTCWAATAAAMTLATFSMRSMMPLRWCAIGSNCAFIGYGLLSQAYPVLALHALLLPFNIVRLAEMRRLVDRVRLAVARRCVVRRLAAPVLTHAAHRGRREAVHQGRTGRPHLLPGRGTARAARHRRHARTGTLVGEIAAFAPDGRRTQTVLAAVPCTLLVIDNASLRQLYFQNPVRLPAHRADRAAADRRCAAPQRCRRAARCGRDALEALRRSPAEPHRAAAYIDRAAPRRMRPDADHRRSPAAALEGRARRHHDHAEPAAGVQRACPRRCWRRCRRSSTRSRPTKRRASSCSPPPARRSAPGTT